MAQPSAARRQCKFPTSRDLLLPRRRRQPSSNGEGSAGKAKVTGIQALPMARRRLTIRATEIDTNNVKSQAPDKALSKHGSSINKLLGIKGAAQES
ncbi:hypothetical protein HN51_007517, partial [Arachis hypogaea]